MSYSPYTDPAAMIIEMCQPINWENIDEQIMLANLGADMACDERFAKKFTFATQKEYCHYKHQKEKGIEQTLSYTEVVTKLRQIVVEQMEAENRQQQEDNSATEIPMIPSYAKEFDTFPQKKKKTKISQTASALLARIGKLKKSLN